MRHLSASLGKDSTLDDLYSENPFVRARIDIIVPEREISNNSDMNLRMENCCEAIVEDGRWYTVIAYHVSDVKFEQFSFADTEDFNMIKMDYWSGNLYHGELTVRKELLVSESE